MSDPIERAIELIEWELATTEQGEILEALQEMKAVGFPATIRLVKVSEVDQSALLEVGPHLVRLTPDHDTLTLYQR